MATEPAKVAKINPLPSFIRLNPRVYLFDPSAKSSVSLSSSASKFAPNAPNLIVLASWMNASPKHIAKFTAYYQTLYPSTPILLITSSTNDFFWITSLKRPRELAPAISAIQTFVSPSNASSKNGILVHAFSNGGGGQFGFLAKQYLETTGHIIPVNALILDSLPGYAHLRAGIRAFSQGLPKVWYLRFPIQLFFAIAIFSTYTLPELLGGKNLSTRLREILNSEKYVRKEAPRCYAFSETDAVIQGEDIEAHAKEAEGLGLKVRRELFVGGEHVGLMRKEPERYWGIVKETWDKRA